MSPSALIGHHPFIKDDIFKVIGIFAQYCDHHNISYISQSTNNIPWNHYFPARNRINVCILIIEIKYPTTVQQFMEAILSQHLTGKYRRVDVIES